MRLVPPFPSLQMLPDCSLDLAWGCGVRREGLWMWLQLCGVDVGTEALCSLHPSWHKPLQHYDRPLFQMPGQGDDQS